MPEPTSFRLSQEARDKIADLMKYHGVNQISIVEMSIRHLHRTTFPEVEPKPEVGKSDLPHN